MVVRETTSLPSPRAVSVPLMAWARLPPRCSKDLDPEVTSEQPVRKFFTGQQDPCVTSPCSGRSHRAAEEEEDELKRQQNDLKESPWKGRGTSIDQDKRGGLGDFAPMDRDMDQEMESKVTESENYSSLETDSDMHFPPILKSRVKPGQQDPGSSSSPALFRTFAQVVSQDPGGGTEAQRNGWEDTVNSPRPQPLSEEGSSGESLGRDPLDKSDGRYVSHLEFAIKCGYSESDLDKVISRRGVECDKNLLLQELIRTFSGPSHLETDSPDEESSEEHDPRAMVQEGHPHTTPHKDEGRLVSAEDDCKTVASGRGEGQAAADGESAGDVQEEEDDELAEDENKNLRDIIIDGSNVAMSHGKSAFSCRGIQIVVDWFRERGHQNITAFVPQWRKETPRLDFPMTDQGLLLKLAAEGVVAFTPARRVKGRRVACYDDRFMLQLAAQTGGVVVSNDNYRDLVKERDEFREVVEERVLMYTFVNDRFMPPEDPLGRMGPTLDNFLRKQPSNEQTAQVPCPYGRKCTFGTKCRYSHPERGAAPHKMVSQLLQEQAARRMQERSARGDHQGMASSGRKTKLARTRSLLHSEHAGAETCGVVPPSPQVLPEAACIDSRAKSPPHPSGKTSDYLRVHRQKLEKALAKAALADSTAANEDVVSHEARERSTAVQHKAGLCGASVFPGHMACCSPHPSSEGQLVSGHLLLAKKLSDEASESTSFSQEELTRQQRGVMTSPPMSIHRTDLPPPGHDTCRYRRSSLPDHHQHHHQQQLPHRPPSAPHQTNTSLRPCTSGSAGRSPHLLPAFPYSQGTVPGVESQMMSHPAPDADALNGGRYVGQYTDFHPGFPTPRSPSLHNNPPSDLFPVRSAAFPSDQLGGGGMDPRNSYPGPQRHTPRAADVSHGDPRYPPCLPFVSHSPPDRFLVPPTHRSFPEHAGHINLNQQQGHTPCQMKAARAFQPPHPQTGSAMRSSPGPAVSESGTGSYHWGGDSMFPNQHVSSFPTPQSPHRPPPPPLFQTVSDGEPSRWQLSSPPQPMTPHSGPPVRPGCGDSGLPVEMTDPRHLVYLHLCKTFAQQRVQAVMNKYPDVTDLQTLCVCLLTEL